MKCDLHVHTKYSYDSNASPEAVVDAAIEKGIDCIAITDHNEIKGNQEARQYAKNKKILVIPAVEIKSRQGDIIALNVKKNIEKGLSAEEAIRRIKQQNGLAVIAHPFGDWHPFRGIEKVADKVDGIEVFNASVIFGNKKAGYLAEKHNLPFTAGSDAHFPEFIGRGYLDIPGKGLSIGQVMQAIKNKACEPQGKGLSLFEKITERMARGMIRFFKIFKKNAR